ncbi:MAG TPA: class III extradiol ring-cleavage dioxygenase [Candidatus Acidoferrum sp.]|nr:class III extradiol ring-cleavage dioxygenase [Candidatus Acidoferrum sp.]
MAAPVLYIPHGGGPMPLLNDASHSGLIAFLKTLSGKFGKPDAIVLISAHWEETVPTVYGGEQHGMLFDYYGFPPETYRYRYPAPGAPAVALRIASLLHKLHAPCNVDTQRGFDHGAFVPMLLIDPDAAIPCIQLSLLKGLNPQAHVQLGQALHELRNDNVVIIGSGMSFHNLQAVWAGPKPDLRAASDQFHQWLLFTVTSKALLPQQRLNALSHWVQAPYAQFCHPRAEHLLPLHVCAGIAGGSAAEVVFDQELMNHKVAGFAWH